MVNCEKRFDLFDLFKLLASILIFVMHISAFSSVNSDFQFYAVELLARWGVPFFFITSAFFLFSKGDKGRISSNVLLNYVKRIVFLYLIWFAFNFPQVAYSKFIANNGITDYLNWLSLFKNIIFSSTFTGSWYLTSSIFGACFVYFICKKLSTKSAILISSVLYLFCILTSAYGNIFSADFNNSISKFFATPCNSIICSPLFFAIGKYIAENVRKVNKLRLSTCVIGTVVCAGLYYVEIIVSKHFGLLRSTDASFLVIPWAIFMVLWCIKSNCKIKGAKYMRKLSTIIYCSQGIILLASSVICTKIFKIDVTHNTFSLIRFALGTAMIIVCIVAVLLLQRFTKFKWTKYMT